MPTLDWWFQDDMSGGENSLVPPDRINENEVAELVNMLPRSTDTGLHVRTSPKQIFDFGGKVHGIFSKRKTDGTTNLITCVTDGDNVKVKDLGAVSYDEVAYTAQGILSSSVEPTHMTVGDDGSISWWEDWTYDTWDAEDGSVWDADDGTAWVDASVMEGMSFSLEVPLPNYNNKVRLNTYESGAFETGSYRLYQNVNDAGETLVGDYSVTDVVELEFDAADTGTVVLRIVVLDTAGGISGGRMTGVTVISRVATNEVKDFGLASSFGDIYFCDWDGNKLLFSDGANGLYVYNTDGAAATRVVDKTSPINPDPNAPSGKYLIQHNGRLFMAVDSANGSFATLAMCGSSDATVARYESWSGSSQSDGGSVDIVPYGTDIKGLASSFGGVLVFKENTIHLFSYTDAYAPWDAVNGGQVELVHSGLGCLAHETIAAADGITYFMGRTDAGDIGLFSIAGTAVDRLSLAVPKKMKDIIGDGSKKLLGEIHDNYYILAAADSQSGEVAVMAVYDILGGAWATFDMVDVTSIYRAVGDDFVLLGTSSGVVYKYPSSTYIEPNGDGVYFKLATRRHIGDTPAHDVYYRLVRLRGGADTRTNIYGKLVGSRGQQYALEPLQLWSYGTDVWDSTDGSTWDASDGTVWGLTYESDEHQAEASFRSQGAQLVVEGNASGDTYLEYVAVGSRPRRAKNGNA